MRKIQITPSTYFLIIMLFIYALLFYFNEEIFDSSMSFFGNVLQSIIPVFIMVIILMILSNYFITTELIIKYTKGRGIKKWFFAVIGGILSSGPIYMWYPLLAELKHKGLSNGLIACFLYNRAIKIPLLPLIILYFSWKYVIVLSFVMILMSVIQGILINKVMEIK